MKNKSVLIITDSRIGIIPTKGRVKKLINLIFNSIYKAVFNILLFNSLQNDHITLICNRSFNLPKRKNLNVIYYDDIFFEVNWLRVRKNIDHFIKNNVTGFKYKGVDLSEVVKDRLAIHLSTDFFPYLDYFSNNLDFGDFDKVICVSPFSNSEKIGIYMAKNKNKDINLIPKYLSFFSIFFDFAQQKLIERMTKKSLGQTTQFQGKEIDVNKLKKGAIVFSISRPIQLKAMVPIYRKIVIKNKNKGYVLSDILVMQRYLSDLSNEKFQLIDLFQFTLLSDRKKLFKSVADDAKIWWEMKVRETSQEVSLESFLIKIDKRFLENQAKEIFPLAALFVENADRMVKTIQPKRIVFFSEKNFTEKSLGQIAKIHNIETFLFFPSNNTDVQDITSFNIADNILVTGDYMKKRIVNHGIDKRIIKVVGDPRVKSYTLLSESEAKSFKRKYGVPLDKKIITVMSLYSTEVVSEEEKRLFLTNASVAVSKFNNTILVVKPHPNEDQKLLEGQLKKWKVKAIIVDKYTNLYHLLSLSEAILFIWSMTGFEAMMLNKPTIAINVFNKKYDTYIPYGSSGASFVATSEVEIEEFLDLILNYPESDELKRLKKDRKRFLSHFVKPDKNSLDKIVRIITS